jgi:hypothetical protein
MDEELKMQIIKQILAWLSGLSTTGVILVYLLLNPEKIEKLSALLWRLLSRLGTLFKSAHKQYVKHDLQSRVNEYARELSKEAPFLASTRARVEWVGNEVTRDSFLEDDQVILRLRRDDSEDLNFVHGAYLFVSTGLLFQVKRYLSQSQRKAVDLYATTSLIEREKPSVKGYFLDNYLHPELADANSKVARFFDAFAKIDKGGYFYPVLLQELDFLGKKVFGARKDDQIIAEVNSLVEFLEPIALRQIGEEADLNFRQQYCRFAIVIIGRSFKLTPEGSVYVDYVRKHLIPDKIETLYMVGLWENRDIIRNICKSLNDTYDECRTRRSKVVLRYGQESIERDQFLVILRMKDVKLFQPSG